MSAPLILGPLGELRNRAFAFYPAIVGIEHNEWRVHSINWTDVHVVNTKTSEDLTIPRRLLGDISSVEAPVLIVGLVKELEYREGAVLPYRRRLLEMPRVVNGMAHSLPAPRHSRPAPVIAIRTESPPAPARRWLRGGVAASIIACIGAGILLRETPLGARYGIFRPVVRPANLTSADDYTSVVQKLGRPYSDQHLTTRTGIPYRRLWYSRRGIAVILGGDSVNPHYAGALSTSGRILHAVDPDLIQQIPRPALAMPGR